MKTKSAIFTGMAMAALLVSPQSATAGTKAPAYDPRYSDLEARLESLEAEVQRSQVKTSDDIRAMGDLSKLTKGWWNDTSISGRMYYNLSNISHERSGVAQTTEGFSFDIKRFYVGIDHKFNDVFSANITTDFQYDAGAGATQIYIKKAYLTAKISKALEIRLGATDLPWVPYVEGLYGFRYIENTLIDRTKFGTSADWGVHVKGKLADGMVEYALAAINGSGYKKPGLPGRSESMDFQGRVSLVFDEFNVGVGGYTGKRGKDVKGTATFHTAQRINVAAGYKSKKIRLGVEYFYADNWNNVTTVASDSADGWSFWASYQFDPQWGVFGRYDMVNPYRSTNPTMEDQYFNVGIQYSPVKIVDFALVYKRDRGENGNLSTGNGTIGGLLNAPGSNGTYEEVGLFGRLRW